MSSRQRLQTYLIRFWAGVVAVSFTFLVSVLMIIIGIVGFETLTRDGIGTVLTVVAAILLGLGLILSLSIGVFVVKESLVRLRKLIRAIWRKYTPRYTYSQGTPDNKPVAKDHVELQVRKALKEVKRFGWATFLLFLLGIIIAGIMPEDVPYISRDISELVLDISVALVSVLLAVPLNFIPSEILESTTRLARLAILFGILLPSIPGEILVENWIYFLVRMIERDLTTIFTPHKFTSWKYAVAGGVVSVALVAVALFVIYYFASLL